MKHPAGPGDGPWRAACVREPSGLRLRRKGREPARRANGGKTLPWGAGAPRDPRPGSAAAPGGGLGAGPHEDPGPAPCPAAAPCPAPGPRPRVLLCAPPAPPGPAPPAPPGPASPGPAPPGRSPAALEARPDAAASPRRRPGEAAQLRALQQTRRLLANARERTRVHTISAAFEALRKQVPCYSYGQKLSKLAILRIACNYILSLARLADLDYSADRSNLSFSECVQRCTRTLQAEGRAKKRKE